MGTHQDAVIAIFAAADEARQQAAKLGAALHSIQVSLVTRGEMSELDASNLVDQNDQMGKTAAVGAATGAALGLLASSALLIIPGLGPVLFAGTMASGLTGGVVGGLVGAMSGWGVREDHIEEYEHELRIGKSLLLVTGDPQQLAEAQTRLENSSAERVVLHAEHADMPVDK